MPNGATRQTRRFSRAKTGCFTCRARHKKCDETKDPETGGCLRCKSSLVVCLGYPKPRDAPVDAHRRKRKTQETEAATTTTTIMSAATSSISPSNDLTLLECMAEAEMAAPIVGGADNGAEFDLLDMPWADGTFDFLPASTNETTVSEGDTPGPSEHYSTGQKKVQRTLARFFASLNLHWWCLQEAGEMDRKALKKAVRILEVRMNRSHVLYATTALMAGLYALKDPLQPLSEECAAAKNELASDWDSLLGLLYSTQLSQLRAFLKWISTTTGQDWDHDHLFSSQPQSQQEYLQLLQVVVSNVLGQITLAAQQDQDAAGSSLSVGPLEYDDLLPVDLYLQAAMNVATVMYACQSPPAFLKELHGAGMMLNSLVGQGRSVQLSKINGMDVIGFRTFAWVDIVNAILLCQSTHLHYCLEDHHDSFLLDPKDTQSEDQTMLSIHEKRRDSGIGGINFSCPDEILAILANAANLHFALLNLRKTGAMPLRPGPSFLPAWALCTANDLESRIEAARHRSSGSEIVKMSTQMWCECAHIFIQTALYRIGPVASVNQTKMRSILDQWHELGPRLHSSSHMSGHHTLPLVFAAFVAVSPSDRIEAREAVVKLGNHHVARAELVALLDLFWERQERFGEVLLWTDLIEERRDNLALF